MSLAQPKEPCEITGCDRQYTHKMKKEKRIGEGRTTKVCTPCKNAIQVGMGEDPQKFSFQRVDT